MKRNTTLPSRAWWIDEPWIAGAPHPTDDELQALRALGFVVLVSLLDEPLEKPRYDLRLLAEAGWIRHALPMADFTAPSLGQLRRFNQILAERPDGARVLVHCTGGLGRTGTAAASYWVRHGLTPRQAVARVRELCPGAIATTAQEQALARFAES